MLSVALVAPEIAAPFNFHWKVGAGAPLAAAVKVTLAPAVMVWLNGWAVMTGATTTAFTASVAPLLVAEPALFVATSA